VWVGEDLVKADVFMMKMVVDERSAKIMLSKCNHVPQVAVTLPKSKSSCRSYDQLFESKTKS
jgi:hypothetical protein